VASDCHSELIPEVVGEDTAVAAVLKDVEAYLAPSEIDPYNQPAAARQILAATLELLNSHELDACFLPNDLKGSIEIDPDARIVFPGRGVSENGGEQRGDLQRSSVHIRQSSSAYP
jgi:hypothetical protein